METQSNAQPGAQNLPCTTQVSQTHEPVKEVLTDPEGGFQYERLTCAHCEKWFGDTLLVQ